MGCVLFEIESPKMQAITTNRTDKTPKYPHYQKLKEQMIACCKNFKLANIGLLETTEEQHIEFSKQARLIFFRELTELLHGFDLAFKKDKTKSFEGFQENFLKIYNKADKEEFEFLEEFSTKQCFACLRDELSEETQGNYARAQAMKLKGKTPSMDLFHVNLNLTPSWILNNIAKLVEFSKKNKIGGEEANIKKSVLIQKEVFNWEKEILKMKMSGALLEKTGEFRTTMVKLLNTNKKKQSFQISPGISTPQKGRKQEINNEIVMTMEEMKEGLKYNFSLLNGVNCSVTKGSAIKKQDSLTKIKKGARFYGRKGVLAFLNEFMWTNNSMEKEHKLDAEIKSILESYRDTILKSQNSTGSQIHRNNCEDNDSVYSEGYSPEEQVVEEGKKLIRSLSNAEDFNFSSIFSREQPFIYFSSAANLQFYLFCGFFYSKTEKDPEKSIQVTLT